MVLAERLYQSIPHIADFILTLLAEVLLASRECLPDTLAKTDQVIVRELTSILEIHSQKIFLTAFNDYFGL